MEQVKKSAVAVMLEAVLNGTKKDVNMEQSIVEAGLKFRWTEGDEQHDAVGLIDGHQVLSVEQGNFGTYDIHYAEGFECLNNFDLGGYETAIHDIIDDYLNERKHDLNLEYTPSENKKYLLECAALNYRSTENVENTAKWLLEQGKVEEAFDLFKGMKAEFKNRYHQSLDALMVGGVEIGRYSDIESIFCLCYNLKDFGSRFNSIAKKAALEALSDLVKHWKGGEEAEKRYKGTVEKLEKEIEVVEQWPETPSEEQAETETPF